MQLLGQLYPEMKVTGLVDEYPQHLKQAEIDVPLSWLERRLGKRPAPGGDQAQDGTAGLRHLLRRRQHARCGSHMALHRRCVHPGGHHGGGRPDVRLRELRGRAHHHHLRRRHQPAGQGSGTAHQGVSGHPLRHAGDLHLSVDGGILRQRGAPEHRWHPVPVHAAVSRRTVRALLPAAQPVQGRGEERALLRRVLHFRDGAGVPRRELHLPLRSPREAALPAQERGGRLRHHRQGYHRPVPQGQGRGGDDGAVRPHGGADHSARRRSPCGRTTWCG